MNKPSENLVDEKNDQSVNSESDGKTAKATRPQTPSSRPDDGQSFEALSEQKSDGIIREFIDFLKTNKKWWLTPIIIVLLLVGLLIGLTTTGAAPFLYPFW